ncbi:sensor kinase/phosphatase LuxQ [Seminavis robusta]|uniref:histidine kinase n=1 Tax=Seminavis robusta TaxID=568900 RepID=A0A9N8E283_9STRA|nr:sensor kinase/phosphatase LuxQ [Seminavis robusta]|eukprot:Sro433_g141880.1 sensor kinase/phosphatase LuxQ (754) ;mRNA; f:51151-53509
MSTMSHSTATIATESNRTMSSSMKESDLFFEESRDLLCILTGTMLEEPTATTEERAQSSAGLDTSEMEGKHDTTTSNTTSTTTTTSRLRFHKINKAWLRILGYPSKEELLSTLCFQDLLHPEDTLDLTKMLTDCWQARLRCYDGTYRWFCWAGTTTTSTTHTNTCMMIMANGRDITSQRKVQDALEANSRRLQESLSIAKLGQWELDLTKNKLHWSEESYRLFQMDDPTHFDHSYQSFLNIIHPDDRDMVNQTYLEHLESRQPYEVVHRLLLPGSSSDSSTPKWVMESCRSEYDAHGNPVRSIGTVQDITELKQAQVDLKAAATKAKEADQLKSAFLANMSHEIRTPMNAVIGFTDLMLVDETATIPEEHRDYLETIQNSGKLLLTLINDILDISKIEAGQLELENKVFSLGEMLKTVEYNACGVLSRKEGNDICFKTPNTIRTQKNFSSSSSTTSTSQQTSSREPVLIKGIQDSLVGDPNRLQQVLNNLLSNAIKFCDKGTVEYSVKLLMRPTVGGMLEFSVSDTGIGIPPDRQQDIFEPFRQAHGDKGACTLGGTGLGLAIARKLVEKMKGEISLETSVEPEDHGSTFRFTIPYAPAEIIPAAAPAKNASGGAVGSASNVPKLIGNILLVDDNRVNLKLAERFVTRMGCQAETAENGHVAIAKYQSDLALRYDIILMDKEMPVMDGIEAVREIRQIEATENRKRIPIIAVTAAAMAGDREECLDAGCDDYITKPLNRIELNTMLAKYLKSR